MRSPLCALFLLMASRLLGTSTAGASVTCGVPLNPVNSSNTGEFSAAASCGPPNLVSASAVISGLSASASVIQLGGWASASIEADYTLLVTGGVGLGIFGAFIDGSLTADSADEGFFDVKFGGTELYRDSTGGFVNKVYGSFTYNVPQTLHLSIFTIVAGYPPGTARLGMASASFDGLEVVQETGVFPPGVFEPPVDGAIVSLVQVPGPSFAVPEPSFAGTVGFCLLVLAAWKIKPKARRPFRQRPTPRESRT